MWKCHILLCGWLFLGWMADARAQTLNVLPPSTGGDPVGIWEADQTPLQVYIPPELLAAFSTFSINGTVSGKMTMDAGGGYVTDYIVTTKATAGTFLGPIVVDRVDTQRVEGTYQVEGTTYLPGRRHNLDSGKPNRAGRAGYDGVLRPSGHALFVHQSG